MESCKEYLFSNYFSNVGFIVAILHVPVLVVFAGVTGPLRTSERRTFRCDVPDCRDDCFKKYDEQYNSPIPLYGFALFCFVPSLVVCIAYCWCCGVKRRVDEIEATMKPDPENPHPRSQRAKTRRLFCCYFLQLLVRFVLGISFALLQNSVFYASNTFCACVFPTEFACYGCGLTANLNVTNIDPSAINCNNSVGFDNAFWAKGIWTVNIIFAFFVFGEMCYVSVRALKSDTFIFDYYFCVSHLFNKRTTPVTMRDCYGKLKSHQAEKEAKPDQIIASPDEKKKALDDSFVDLVIFIMIGRAEHDEHVFDYNSSERHEIFDIYLKPKREGAVPIEKLAELFLPNNDTENARKILIIGHPGVGKSLLCKKLLLDWSKNADSTKTFKYFFFFQFKWFNSGTEKYSLKKLLSIACQDGKIDDYMFQDILDHSERVLLVFDGLDEFQHLDSCSEDEQAQGGNSATEEMDFSALYVKLVKGTQLGGATVVTTCRPNVEKSVASLTFDRKVEIMGFTKEKVKEYVRNVYAKDIQAMETILEHLNSSSELLSLCYIPANISIICFLFERWIAFEKNSKSTFPTTKVYEQALNLFILKHHPEYRGKTLTSNDLRSGRTFSDPVESNLRKLESLAKAGVEEGKLLFESRQVEGMENFGLLNPLEREVEPNCFEQYYYFNHLTIQEWLAAREIAKFFPSNRLHSFIFSNKASDPKWQFVIQSVAGLLPRQIEKKEAVNSFVSQLNDALTAVERENEQTKRMALLMLKCLYEYNNEDVVKEAASELDRNSKFDKKIDLSQCQVTSVECSAIAYFVKHLVELTVLDLGDNRITDQGLFSICEAFKHKKCKLSKLILYGNSITEEGESYVLFETNYCNHVVFYHAC